MKISHLNSVKSIPLIFEVRFLPKIAASNTILKKVALRGVTEITFQWRSKS